MGGFVSESSGSDTESDSSLVAVKEQSSEETRSKAVEEQLDFHKRKNENWENFKKKHIDEPGTIIDQKMLNTMKEIEDRKFDKKAEQERKAREGEHFKKLGISDAIRNGALDQTIEDDLDGSENLDQTMATGYSVFKSLCSVPKFGYKAEKLILKIQHFCPKIPQTVQIPARQRCPSTQGA